MNKECTKIYLSFSPSLLIEILKKRLFKKNNKLKNYHGIYLLTKKDSINIKSKLKDKDNIYISYYIVRLAHRFKRLKLHVSDKPYYSLPYCDNLDLNLRYIISITDLIIRKYELSEGKKEIYLNRLKDQYVNIFLKRYLKKNYNIDVKYVFRKNNKTG